jgi:hypothetical protein
MEPTYLSTTFQELEALFNNVLSIKWLNIVQKPPTFLEISGYPDYENVCSNIYQFFLLEQHHGFGNLFLSALDDCVENQDLTMDDYRVLREVTTDKGGRIDILLEQVDTDEKVSKAILIENKIFHTLDNDLNDYLDSYKHIDDRFLIVLTLKETKVNEPFINITHQQWIRNIQRRLGDSLITSNLKYLALLQDFIQHIQGYFEKSIEMDAIKYLHENGDKIDQIKLLEKEGLNYIAEDIGKNIIGTNWSWGRIIPSGLQIPRANKPILGYVFFNRIFIEHEIHHSNLVER